ncbi:hypothetical protein SNOG_02314 [Parastagonospora nodorum SN15]|uniref:Uncharacterized protein n=1 Tax=Phaeosphaeria nodorum (strain SN15 / ATCC MYA-4574 / FGSC 10173) TaxID=321614 RepID=Q0V100_PHANO|nr:hypothetical protein SNOG_02314 [Parastagonospora nodorum SN15]EAT90526.1 hypothetical protein SNOG_02314 [Parastagonospora nodorum SN15]
MGSKSRNARMHWSYSRSWVHLLSPNALGTAKEAVNQAGDLLATKSVKGSNAL